MTIEAVKAPWDGVALVCRKCSKKLDGGFGPNGDLPLAKALRSGLKEQGRRRALRVVPVACLGLCPKRAVTVVGPGAPGHVMAVRAGTDVREVLTVLVPG